MDILFNNPLANMTGIYFLMLYSAVIVAAAVGLSIGKRVIDKSGLMGLPPIPSAIDPFEVAYLRGGPNEMTRSVIFSLMQKGLLEIDESGAEASIRPTGADRSGVRLSLTEEKVLDSVGTTQPISWIFGNSGLSSRLETEARNYQARLEERQLLTDSGLRAQFGIWKKTALGVIFGLGAYKLAAALMHGRSNVIGIIVLCIFGFIAVKAVSKMPRITKLGKVYLDRLQLAFASLKEQAPNIYPAGAAPGAMPATMAGVDPLMLSVGLFGAGVVAGTAFDSYDRAFRKASGSTSGGESACSAGCGSDCSSGDSGSSGDGGSSCGSGCGGCGGGGD